MSPKIVGVLVVQIKRTNIAIELNNIKLCIKTGCFKALNLNSGCYEALFNYF